MDNTVVELFAGVGGFRCGLNHIKTFSNDDGKAIEEGKWKFVWVNQWEPSTVSQAAYDCYVKRFGNDDEDIVNKDIAEAIKTCKIPDHTLLVGGFPCQDYSVARSLSNEKGIKGKKGVLWWQICKVLEMKHPSFVLLENVDRLLRSPSNQRGRDFGVMLRTLYEKGYGVEWRVINAAEYGFPQKRRRVFIFAYHKSTRYFKKMNKFSAEEIIKSKGIFTKKFPIKSQNYKGDADLCSGDYNSILSISEKFKFHFFNSGVMIDGKIYTYKTEPLKSTKMETLGEILERGPIEEKYFLSEDKIKKFSILKGPKKIDRKKPNGEDYCYSEGGVSFPDNLDVPARTMLTSEGTVNRSSHVVRDLASGKLRILTPIETERIQMFPPNWTNIGESMTERRRYFMMGNALVVGVVERLGEAIEEIVDNED